MNTPNHVRQFYKWSDGENRPRLDKALPLMEKTGMLTEDGDAPTQDVHNAKMPRDRLAVIEEGVIALLAGQDALLLEAGVARPEAPGEQQSPTQDVPKKKAAKGR